MDVTCSVPSVIPPWTKTGVSTIRGPYDPIFTYKSCNGSVKITGGDVKVLLERTSVSISNGQVTIKYDWLLQTLILTYEYKIEVKTDVDVIGSVEIKLQRVAELPEPHFPYLLLAHALAARRMPANPEPVLGNCCRCPVTACLSTAAGIAIIVAAVRSGNLSEVSHVVSEGLRRLFESGILNQVPA